MSLYNKILEDRINAVIGLGYIGIPIAVDFSKII